MYISCPNCKTNFIISPEQMTPAGRKVKCSKCSHIWHHTFQKSKPESVSTPISHFSSSTVLTQGVNLPVLRTPQKPEYFNLLSLLMIALIIALSAILWKDDLKEVSAFFSKPTLEINRVEVETDTDKAQLIVRYNVFNNSNQEMEVPLIMIRLLDENSQVIGSHFSDNTRLGKLAPNHSLSLKTEFASPPPSVKNVDLVLGNRLDFLLASASLWLNLLYKR